MDSRIEALISDFSMEMQKRGVEVAAIVLFGSQSDGTAKDGSDVDLAGSVRNLL